MKPEPERGRFQHLPRGNQMLMYQKSMFDRYYCIKTFCRSKTLEKHSLDFLFNFVCWLVALVFYGPSKFFRSFRARSVNLSTPFLGKTPRQFTST